MNTQHWLEDFNRRMQHIDDDIVSSMLTQTVAEYVRMTSMSPDMSDWFMNYSAKNVDDLSRLAVTSREVVWLFPEQLGFEFVPVLHRLQGRLAAQG